MLELAKASVERQQVISSTETFEVYEMAENSTMQGYVLVLYFAGKDIPAENMPEAALILPVKIDDRNGYLMHKDHISKLT